MTPKQWEQLKIEAEKAGRKAPRLTYIPPGRLIIEGDKGDIGLHGYELDALMAYLPWLDQLWGKWAACDTNWVMYGEVDNELA